MKNDITLLFSHPPRFFCSSGSVSLGINSSSTTRHPQGYLKKKEEEEEKPVETGPCLLFLFLLKQETVSVAFIVQGGQRIKENMAVGKRLN